MYCGSYCILRVKRVPTRFNLEDILVLISGAILPAHPKTCAGRMTDEMCSGVRFTLEGVACRTGRRCLRLSRVALLAAWHLAS